MFAMPPFVRMGGRRVLDMLRSGAVALTPIAPPASPAPRFGLRLPALSVDLLANLGSLAFLGLVGIALNVVIGRFYGPVELGIFNLVFALFIFASQFGSAGLQ